MARGGIHNGPLQEAKRVSKGCEAVEVEVNLPRDVGSITLETVHRNLLGQKTFFENPSLMLADQLINRVEYMHTRGFIHREIKPDNFLIRCISSIWIGEDMQRPSDSQEHSVQVKIIPLLHLVKAWASRNSDDGFLSKPL
ncbi:unnamed protein product, partial [Thlaspi arvense]